MTTMSRRHLLTSAAGAAIAVGTASCGSTAKSAGSDGSTVVNVIGLSDVFQEHYVSQVVDPFNASQKEIQVRYKGFPTSAEILSSLRSQKSSPAVDVVIFDYSVAQTANGEGLMTKVDPAGVPNLARLVTAAKSPDGYGPKLTFDNLSLVFNTEGGQSGPRAFADLADPRYRGKVAMDGPPDIRGLGMIMIFADGKLQNTGAAFDRFKKISSNVETWKPSPEVNQYVIANPGSVGVGWNARAQMFAEQSGGKLGVVKVPSEGSVLQSNTINLVAQGPAPVEASLKFLDYALSAEPQVAFSSKLAYGPVNADAELPAELKAKVAEQKRNIIPIDWAAVAAKRDELTSTWQREVQGG